MIKSELEALKKEMELLKKEKKQSATKKEAKIKNVCAVHIVENNSSFVKLALIPEDLKDGDVYDVIQMEQSNFKKLARLITNTTQFSVQWNKYKQLKEQVIFKDDEIKAF